MLARLRHQCVQIIAGGGDPEDESSVDRRRIPHGDLMVTRCLRHAMCAGSRIAEGGQGVDEFGAAELGFEFADAIDHIALEVFDGWRSWRVGLFEPVERAAEVPKLVKCR